MTKPKATSVRLEPTGYAFLARLCHAAQGELLDAGAQADATMVKAANIVLEYVASLGPDVRDKLQRDLVAASVEGGKPAPGGGEMRKRRTPAGAPERSTSPSPKTRAKVKG